MPRHPLARRSARRALALAALAAALGPATPAAAAPRREPAPKGAPATAPAAALAGPTAAPSDVALPPPPAGTTLQRRRVGWLGVAAGPWVGLDGGQGAALQVDYGYLRTPPGWTRLQLEVRLSVMVSRPSDETDLTTAFTPPFGPPQTISTGVEELTAWVIEVVPTARLLLPVSPQFALFADAGVGLAQTVERYDRDETFAGHTETSRNVTTAVLRAGAGMSFELSERARLVFLPLALSLQIDTGFSAFVPTLGLAYRL